MVDMVKRAQSLQDTMIAHGHAASAPNLPEARVLCTFGSDDILGRMGGVALRLRRFSADLTTSPIVP